MPGLLHRGDRPCGCRLSGEIALVGLNKLCELEDFDDPDLRRFALEAFAQESEQLPAFAAGPRHRKYWEVAQTARALLELGAAHREAELLGVAAGREATIFWATNYARRVVATDFYRDPGDWEQDAPSSMLDDPGAHASCEWDERSLEVVHMDALRLRFADESFDGVFCTSSIEHFGGHYAALRAAHEMWRVLKPGGIASISTEYRLEGPPTSLPGTMLFDVRALDDLIVRRFDWELVEPLELRLSEATLSTVMPLAEAIARPYPREPRLVLRHGDYLFTSVHLALRKAA